MIVKLDGFEKSCKPVLYGAGEFRSDLLSPAVPLQRHWVLEWASNWISFYSSPTFLISSILFGLIDLISNIMNGNRGASGLSKGYSGPSLHGSNASDQRNIELKGDFRQASHTMQKMCHSEVS